MFPPRIPLPKPAGAGPSLMGRALLLVGSLLLLVGSLLLYPTFRALNMAIVGTIESWRALVGGGALVFVSLVLASIIRMLFAIGWKLENKARQAAIVRLANQMPAHIADVRGTTPGLVAELLKPSVASHYAAKIAEAERPFPQLHSFNQHLHNQVVPAPALPEPASSAPAGEVPSFAQLLDRGEFGPGRPLVLGYDALTRQPITGSWRDLYSCGVGALQGAGKSWLLAFLLGQSAAAGAKFIVCDPHAGADESLSTRIAALAGAFMCDVASTDDEILAALRLANDKLEKRKAGKGGDWPIIVAVDEWSSLLRGRLGDELPPLVQNITEQGRKYNTNAILSAQGWTVDAAGMVRNRLTAHYVLRQRDAEARYQLGLKSAQLPADIRTLPDATGYLLTVRGDLTKVVIPTMTSADLARVGELVQPASRQLPMGFQAPTAPLPAITAEAAGKRPGSAPVEAASKAAQRGNSASPEAMRAAALFRQKTSEKAIVKELRGIEGGRNYDAARDEVRNLIIEGLLAEGVQS